MGIEIVRHQRDLGGFWICDINQLPQLLGEIHGGAPIRHPHFSAAGQRFDPQEDIADAVPFIFIVFASADAGAGR